mmetsp:Transcript_282/g.1104  ORF Transcript_282/g.1104 Transcript_282/m.1104 type:complete len:205 (-) Transcript_282:7-621(-)
MLLLLSPRLALRRRSVASGRGRARRRRRRTRREERPGLDVLWSRDGGVRVARGRRRARPRPRPARDAAAAAAAAAPPAARPHLIIMRPPHRCGVSREGRWRPRSRRVVVVVDTTRRRPGRERDVHGRHLGAVDRRGAHGTPRLAVLVEPPIQAAPAVEVAAARDDGVLELGLEADAARERAAGGAGLGRGAVVRRGHGDGRVCR